MTTYILCILYTDAYEKIYTTKVHYILKTAGLKTTQFGIFWQPGAGSKRDEASNGLYLNHFLHAKNYYQKVNIY